MGGALEYPAEQLGFFFWIVGDCVGHIYTNMYKIDK